MCARQRTAQLLWEMTSLPALPAVVQRLHAVLHDPDYTADQVTAVVRTEPALATRVLKLANSPAYGLPGSIDSVARAVVILGSRNLRHLVTAAGAAEAMDRMRGGADLEDLWCHAAYTATAARALALKSGHPCPEEAFLAGLIHDIGELALAVLRPRDYARLRRLPVERQRAQQRAILGMSHTRAGRQLLSSWNLPEEITVHAGLHHSREAITAPAHPTLALVALADLLSRVRGLGHEPPPAEALLHELLAVAGVGDGLDAALLREIDLRYLETSRFLHPDHARIQAPPVGGESRRVSLVCTDARRSRRLRELLVYHGETIVPLDACLAEPAQVDLVLLDPHSLDERTLARIGPALTHAADRLALYAGAAVVELAGGLVADLPVLPVLFGRGELHALPASGVPTLSPR